MNTKQTQSKELRPVASVRLTKLQAYAVYSAMEDVSGFSNDDYSALDLGLEALTIRECGDWGVITRELVASLYRDAYLNSECGRSFPSLGLCHIRRANASSQAAMKIRKAIGIAPAKANEVRVVLCREAVA